VFFETNESVKIVKNYPTQVYFIVHPFPLPLHHNAFFAAQGGSVVNALAGEDAFFQYVDLMFANQDRKGTTKCSHFVQNSLPPQPLEKPKIKYPF
jgi:hypothetical protein